VQDGTWRLFGCGSATGVEDEGLHSAIIRGECMRVVSREEAKILAIHLD
jgi:hypothetical protein